MSSFSSPTTRRFFIIAIIGYSILLFLSLWYYQERTLFADIAYHLFYLLKDDHYAIQNGRFGAVFTQSIPLIGKELGWSLKTITIAYSMGFVLFYFTIFLLIWSLLKNRVVGLVMLLLSTLMVSGTFFWIQSEFPQGLAFMLLTFGIITRKTALKDFYKLELLLLIPMIITVVYFHPLIFIPFTYICVFLWLSRQTFPVNKILLGASFGLFWLVFLLKNTLLKVVYEYDSTATSHLKHFITLFPNYFLIESNANFLLYISTTALSVLFFGMLYWYACQKNWSKFFLLLSFFTGYFLLVGVSYSHSQFIQFYMENLYLPLSIIVAFPFVVDGLPQLKANWQVAILSFIVFACFSRVISHSSSYTKRLNWQKELLAKTAPLAHKKLLIDSKNVPKDLLLHTYWGSPYEFWLLSSMTPSPEGTRSILIHDDPSSFEYTKNAPDYFVTYWGNFQYKKLPESYFIFNDNSPYIYYNPKDN